MRITICFGGSIFGFTPEPELLNEIARSLRNLRNRGHELLVVTGGGKISREYIKSAKELKVPNKILDKIGIMVTRLNAQLLIAALGDISPPEPLKSFEIAINEMFKGKIPVMGGTTPGHTTDAVATDLAKSSNSELLIFFADVGGVYTDNPKQKKEAKKIDSMKISELVDMVSKEKFEPGISAIIDPLAAKILQQNQIRTLVLGKKEISRLAWIVEGSEHDGTVITPG